MRTQLKTALAAAVLASVALAGCGGGDDNRPANATSVPDSAVASVGNFIAFIKSLVSDETSEPLAVNVATPPTDDSSEPQAVN